MSVSRAHLRTKLHAAGLTPDEVRAVFALCRHVRKERSACIRARKLAAGIHGMGLTGRKGWVQ